MPCSHLLLSSLVLNLFVSIHSLLSSLSNKCYQLKGDLFIYRLLLLFRSRRRRWWSTTMPTKIKNNSNSAEVTFLHFSRKTNKLIKVIFTVSPLTTTHIHIHIQKRTHAAFHLFSCSIHMRIYVCNYLCNYNKKRKERRIKNKKFTERGDEE